MSKHECDRITSASYTPQAGDNVERCRKRAHHFHEEIDKWFCHSCETFLYNPDGSLKQVTSDSYGGCEEYNAGTDDAIDHKHEEFGD
jgi:hypothetical protein